MVACLGLWNQIGSRQNVVHGYRGDLRWARLAFNLLARCLGWPQFPRPGSALPAITAALPLAAEGETRAFTALLNAARAHARHTQPMCECVLIGVCADDPLFDTCRRASLFSYITQIYLVNWDEEMARPERFRNAAPYLELGCL